jgi:hypothetical protein
VTAPFTRLRRGRGITTGVALAVLAAGLTSVSVATPAKANVSSFCTSVGGAQVGATNGCLVSFTELRRPSQAPSQIT